MENMSELIGIIFMFSGCLLMLMIVPAIFLFSKYVEEKFGAFDAKEVIVSRYLTNPTKYNLNFFKEFSLFMRVNKINFFTGTVFYCGLASFIVLLISLFASIWLGYLK